ncbi:MAG: hypothetical protein GX677_00035 [Treponema sp.]|nr:hypothetical protein [Treponema sp.]
MELSRTIGSSFGVSGETNINLLMYSVKVNAEVTLNTSYTQTWTQNVSVPPYKTVIAKGGTDRVKGTAYILTLNSDCSITKGNPFSYNYGYRKAYTWD